MTEIRLLTAPAAGAIAVVQIVGPDAKRIFDNIFRPRLQDGSRALLRRDGEPARLCYGSLLAGDGEVFDDGLAAALAEDVCEFHLHGGVRIVQRFVRRARELGAHLPADEPGSMADRAFDWLGPLERWVQACLPQASTHRAVRWLLGQPDLWAARIRQWREWIRQGEIGPVAAEVDAILDDSRVAGAAWRGRTLAILGLPNAGKSTIANRLAGRDVSLVSQTPGTTRDWVGEPIALGGWPITLVDTAGLRASDDPIEAEGVARALGQAGRADARLWVVDASTEDDPQELLLTAQDCLKSGDVLVYSKCDLPRRRVGGTRKESVPASVPVVEVSARTGTNWSVLEETILKALRLLVLQEQKPLVFCAELQVRIDDLALALRSHRAESLAVLDRLLPCEFDAGPGSSSSR